MDKPEAELTAAKAAVAIFGRRNTGRQLANPFYDARCRRDVVACPMYRALPGSSRVARAVIAA